MRNVLKSVRNILLIVAWGDCAVCVLCVMYELSVLYLLYMLCVVCVWSSEGH